ncbi:MAG: metal-dependent hydrolase [Sulfolobales archaeon]
MRRDVHIVFGVGSSLVSGFFLETMYAPLLIIGGFLGSIAPDLDLRIGHRRVFHNISFLTLMVLVILFLLVSLGIPYEYIKTLIIGFVAGFISHLVGDSVTYRGVDLLYPFSKKSFRVPLGASSSLLVNALGMVIGVSEVLFYIYLKIY